MVDIEGTKRRIRSAKAKDMPFIGFKVENAEELIERLHSAEARCAELQAHQDDYDRAHAGVEAAERDAARYRWLRAVDNDYGRSLLATCGPDKLDKAIDAEIAKESK